MSRDRAFYDSIITPDAPLGVSHARPLLRNTEDTKDIVFQNGDFHTSGHGSFASNEGFHDCKYGHSKLLLGKTKIPKHVKDFENDSYMHVTTFMREDYIGTLAYFLLDVTKPPPELLLDDPLTYRELINHHGGLTAFESMYYAGGPQCHWSLAARSEDGDKCVKLRAIEFHKMRAFAHKPVEARVLLMAALGTEATHPKVANVVTHQAFFNWLGTDATSMFRDRAIECLHRFQSEVRPASFKPSEPL